MAYKIKQKRLKDRNFKGFRIKKYPNANYIAIRGRVIYFSKPNLKSLKNAIKNYQK
jgi:hypothetical protein